MDPSCHTTSPRDSQVMDQARLRLAMARKTLFHCFSSSAFQWWSQRPRVRFSGAPVSVAALLLMALICCAVMTNLPVAVLCENYVREAEFQGRSRGVKLL